MEQYYRLTFMQATEGGKGKRRTAWVYQISPKCYRVVDKEGDESPEILIMHPQDIIRKVPAKMNLKYAELETEAGLNMDD